MGVPLRGGALHRPRPLTIFVLSLSLLAAVLWLFPCVLTVLHDFYALASLPFAWPRNADAFMIQPDEFDLSFASYDAAQTSAGDGHPDRVPPVLHHIVLGGERATLAAHDKWSAVRQSCLDIHPGWEAHVWTDAKAEMFVAEHFPELKDMWDAYQYPIQRIDALRYMVLYQYGGVILDMDLKCKRALGPLRRFDFVSPAAHPQGFSIGFMMASKRNELVGQMVGNLKRFNRHWLGLPYATVMFSTGCHYASTIHALQPNRTSMKVLAGPPDNFKLHSLNGPVSTPIFDHLGSSSWHSYDANLIVSVGKYSSYWRALAILISSVATFLAVRKLKRKRWGKLGGAASPARLQSPVLGENLKLQDRASDSACAGPSPEGGVALTKVE